MPTASATLTILALVLGVATVVLITAGIRTSRLLTEMSRPEQVNGPLAHRPWYIERFTLVCWQYILIEETLFGVSETRLRSSIKAQGVGSLSVRGHRLRLMAMSQPWLAALFAIAETGLVLALVWSAIRAWSDEPAWSAFAGLLAAAAGSFYVWNGRLVRRDRQLAIGRKISAALLMPEAERVAFLEAVAAEELHTQSAA